MSALLVLSAGTQAQQAAPTAQQPIILKFSHVVAASSSKGKAADYFKKIVEERTQNRVKVEVYPNGQLYKDKEELEALQLGSVQMLAPTFGKFGPMGLREFEVFDLPYLFDDLPQARKVTQGPIGRALLKKLDAKGLAGLAMLDDGFMQWTANKPILVPADMKGLKIRIQSSKVIDARVRAVGALPQVMSFTEVYQGLQSGSIDGQENPASVIFSSRLNEVQKYMTISDHGYHGYVLLSNKKFWDGLPPDIRTIMDGAVKDTTAYFDTNSQKENDDALEEIRKSGKTRITTLTPAEKQEWKKVMFKVHAEMADRIGKDLIRSIYKEIGYTTTK
ncbi:DctP family TRAP transporter solute-binding subunit [Herbaspirillum sp. RTI4]|uniref:DctP family TRAP transporter solute-binding subunit n=1 Tax=Herbaspirillum sp. RTI4 TaxID=3048640 RepID=UPI002AB581A8|nr:DctP family TRAP transporter solute-binding subunit [Herbaspirillum sp. RTI4]MDY7579852.1 DctP family TRAP transporter solute-binding subunit [Herbaspirillum sp. RTI4]MEA9981939.1 DctP family TRAP transporter solute-binding subunit [Herbaspirillum sp. RTI4]